MILRLYVILKSHVLDSWRNLDKLHTPSLCKSHVYQEIWLWGHWYNEGTLHHHRKALRLLSYQFWMGALVVQLQQLSMHLVTTFVTDSSRAPVCIMLKLRYSCQSHVSAIEHGKLHDSSWHSGSCYVNFITASDLVWKHPKAMFNWEPV